MLRGPQVRILSRLSDFPRSLETAWDVPRDICLPGIAEYLGVVRSALHGPINDLVDKGYLIERKAHVIGGGSRKRKVYHITDEGREISANSKIPRREKKGKLYGKVPERSEIIGRKEFIEEVLCQEKIILTGLPGIGKTSILHEISSLVVSKGKTVRFSTVQSFSDVEQIFSDWGFEYTDEEAVLNASKNNLLILDEFQEINPRHLNRIQNFLKNAKNVIIASRPPLLFSEGFEILDVPPLAIDSAVKLLPNEIQEKELVASRLGCHPLALLMHDMSTSLPEEGVDLQTWVRDVILQGLNAEMNAINELSILPIPVDVENLQTQEYIPDLDDYALLRWFDHGVELHHLIRNVRSLSMSKDDYKNAAEYWAKIDGDNARLVEMYLRLKCGENIESYLLSNSESLMVRSSAGLATLIGDALMRYPSDKLHRIGAIVAIERGEAEIANEHLNNINAPDLRYAVDLLNGLDTTFNPKDSGVKSIISEASRLIDDRLPGGQIKSDVNELLDQINLSELDSELKKVVLVAIAKIRHSWYIANKKWAEANEITKQLESISNENDKQIIQLKLRAQIAETPQNSPTFDKLVDEIFALDGLKGTMLKIALILQCDAERAAKLLNKIELPTMEEQTNLNSARRLAASIWYLRAKYKTHNSYSSMAESISLWKKALCPNASKSASEMLHKML